MKPLVASPKLARQALRNTTDPVLVKALQSVIEKQEVYNPLKYSRKEIPTDEYLEDPDMKLSAAKVAKCGVKLKPDQGTGCRKSYKELGLETSGRRPQPVPSNRDTPLGKEITIDTVMPK